MKHWLLSLLVTYFNQCHPVCEKILSRAIDQSLQPLVSGAERSRYWVIFPYPLPKDFSNLILKKLCRCFIKGISS
ncbi:hypothetical protein GDO81_012568 [Engystomops pustulosus]|uniref:Uncharacterized protein n=1 Tax=Engystomops pustulosus TaxID=76066 RepID=A0AAV7BMG7_ENGPU|nr:hypothetical protein GDO81_012568 [Engystomops pustulosus]